MPSKLLLILLLAVTSAACRSRKDAGMPERETDPELKGFVTEFLAAAKKYDHPIPSSAIDRLRVVVFVDDLADAHAAYGDAGAASSSPGSEVAGTCTDAVVDDTMGAGAMKWKTGEKSWSEVWIGSDMRPDTAEQKLQLRELMFHELGHCLLGKDHVEDAPHHIMSPALSNDFPWLEQNWDRLLAELFK